MNFQTVIDFIRGLYPGRDFIPLHEPYFGGNEKSYLTDCIDSTYVSSVGKYVDQFESEIRNFTKSGCAVATVNGTAALHIALKLAGVENGDLVITQALTFIATCNAISYCGAEPVFVDIDHKTLGLSADALEAWLVRNAVLAEVEGDLKCFYLPQMDTNERSQINTNTQQIEGEGLDVDVQADLPRMGTNEKTQIHTNTLTSSVRKGKDKTQQAETFDPHPPVFPGNSTQTSSPSFVPICDLSFVKIRGLKKISACVPMHTFGIPCEIDRIVEICARYHIPVVEDSAESIGSYYKGRHTGTFGKLGILSFNGNKTITTGGGGMIITDDPELGRLAKHITTTAKKPHPWKFEHDMIGYNYRLPNINAALGCAQMEMLPEILRNKRETASMYEEFFRTMPDIEFVTDGGNHHSNYWLNAILLPGSAERDEFLAYTNDNKVMTRPAWIMMNKLDMFRDSVCGELDVSEEISARLVNIPSSYRVSKVHKEEHHAK